SASNSVNSATNSTLPYDLVKDLQGVTQATAFLCPVHPSVGAREVGHGIDRLRESKSGQAQFRFVRQQHAAAFRRRAPEPHGRRQDRAYPVQRYGGGDPGDDGG